MGAEFVVGGGVGNFLLLGRSENEHRPLRNASKIEGDLEYIKVEKDGIIGIFGNGVKSTELLLEIALCLLGCKLLGIFRAYYLLITTIVKAYNYTCKSTNFYNIC